VFSTVFLAAHARPGAESDPGPQPPACPGGVL